MVNSLILNIRKNTILDNYYKSLNVIPTDLLYLGLLQHYSAPSPLIDFSYSYKAALYFATKDINIAAEDNNICDYFSLYYIDINKCGENLVRMDDFLNDGLQNGQKLYEETSLRFPQYEIDKHLLDDIYEYTKWMKTDSLSDNGICSIKIMFIDNPLNFNAVITPYTHERLYWSNLNIVAQDGCFLLYNNENQPLEEYFNPDHGALPKISCIDIHKSLTEYIRAQYLQEQTESKLFPNMQQLVNNAYVSFQQEL